MYARKQHGGLSKKEKDMEDNYELKLARDFIEKTGCNIFLTGKAGTGKTTFLKELRERSPKRMVVLAPTGIAAINAGGTTIHSFFQLPLSPFVPGASFGGREQKRYQFGKVKRNIIRTLDLLVIDEISMVRADLLDAVDSVMRRYRVHNLPFGGVQLLLIGDLQQLAPVVKDDEWEMMKSYYDTPFFFSSKALNAAGYHTIELQTVYRQQDGKFLSILNNIRENKADDNTLAELNRRYIPDFTPPKGSNYIRLTTHNYQAQQINDRQLERLGGAASEYRAEVEGTFPESSYPADETLTLKAGAQVMFIKNDPNRRYYNGMIGEVVDAGHNSITVMSRDTGETIDIEPAEWANSKYAIDSKTKEITETVEGVFRQYPLRLAWAITIHKSQGLTFEHAIIDASHSFAHGQAYVALSRCKSLEGMVLCAPLGREAVINDDTVSSFIQNAEANRPTADTLNDMRRAYVAQILDELFSMAMLRQAVEMLTRTLTEHFYNKYHTMLTEYTNARNMLDELAGVAEKFGKQYRGLLAGGHDAADPLLQERIHKAATYFAGRLETMKTLFAKTRVETGNKLVRAQFDDRHATLGEELGLKTKMLGYISDPDCTFTTSDYLRRKARILLGDSTDETASKERTRKTKTPKTPKEPKIPTAKISYDMFISGMDIDRIAAGRSLTTGTIFNHLAKYVEQGTLPIEQLMPQEHIDEIRNYARIHPQELSATQIKAAIGDAISYDEIRIVKKIYGIG